MPSSSSIRKLHLAKNIEELNKKAEYKLPVVNDATMCSKSARKLFDSATLYYEKGDEELAYMQYMKFVSFYSKIRKAKSYEQHKKFCSDILGDAPNIAMTRAEELSANLVRRYSLQEEANKINNAPVIEIDDKKEKKAKDKDTSVGKENKDNLDNSSKPVLLSNDVKTDNVKDCITSIKLYEMMNSSDTSLLILDARPASDFEDSHMKHDCCVNIPEEILEPGVTALALEKKLPTKSLRCWRKRCIVDFVIILDWKSTLSDLFIMHPLHTLNQAIYKWDMSNILKSKPLILEGGYESWLLHYPALTTNANVSHNTSQTAVVPSLCDTNFDIDYPDLDKAFIESPENSPQTFINCINDTSVPSLHLAGSKVPKFPPINRDAKPLNDGVLTNGNLPGSVGLPRRKSNEGIFEDEVIPKPLVDRKLKPKPSLTTSTIPDSSHSADSERNDSISQSLKKEESALEENIRVETERLNKEREFEILRQKKLHEHEEAMRLEIQRQQEELLAVVQALEQQAESKDLEYHKLKEENYKMKQELGRIKEKGEETDRLKILEAREAHEKQLKEEVIRLRELRKMNERKEVDKKRIEKPDQSSVKSIDTATVKPDRKVVNPPDVHVEDIEHFVPLKDESTSGTPTSHGGLSRSHSSPNIAQLVENEVNQAFMPKFDRSLKPAKVSGSFSPTVSRSFKPEELNAARIRNLQPIYGNQGQAVTGLRNLGNTCFMNAVIQCLGVSIPLSLYFTRGVYRDDIVRDGKQSSRGEVAEEFAAVIWALWTGVYKSITPRDFKDTVSKYLSVCVGYEQQDSHEFLIVLLEKLHGDLNKGKSTQPNQTLDLDNLPPEIAQQKFWSNHKRMNKSIISELFEGLMQSTLRCLSCDKISNNFEVLSFLSLPISSSIRCSLIDCLELFLKAETMTGDGAWHCPQCKEKQEARKEMIICQLPEILIIHLKRFSFEGMWRQKLQTYVDFPFELQMKPYVSQPPIKNQCLSYKLYGVVNHYGTMEGGHYVAYCKNAVYDKWFKYDDHEVFAMAESEVKTSAAYILFYSCSDFRHYLEH